MVNLPIYGEAGGVPFPRFGIELSKDETPEDFVPAMEQEVRGLLGISLIRSFSREGLLQA